MYQTIDDNETELAPARSRTGVWPFAIGLALLLAIVTGVYLNSPGPAATVVPIEVDRAATEAYRKAISEQNPALRRARLNDYLLTIENAPHQTAVLAQLDVINRYELSDWEQLQSVVYSLRANQDAKIAAIDDYEGRWGSNLLGARDDDLVMLKAEITGDGPDKNLTERKFEGGPSPIPNTVPDTELAGGPRPVITYVPPRRPITPPTTSERIVETTPLRVRRNVTPRYPRKALRRNVEAVVTLKLNIDARGHVAMTELIGVEAESYERDFVKAAERAAMRTRYHPRTENGQAVPVSGVTKRYRFEADN